MSTFNGEHEQLARGMAALGISVETSAVDLLIQYSGLLRQWNRAYNLVSTSGLADLTVRHLLDSRHAPNVIVRTIMDLLVISALKPLDPGQSQPDQAIALWLLYVRSHWLKMPPLLLARHLMTKALYRWRIRFRPALAKAETKPN